jgi:hypothetical protein
MLAHVHAQLNQLIEMSDTCDELLLSARLAHALDYVADRIDGPAAASVRDTAFGYADSH